MRLMQTFYGIHTVDWGINWGGYIDHNKLLVKEYINEGCDTEDYSSCTETHTFIYPHHIAKKYFIEGVIEGHITIENSTASAYFCSYRLTVGKIHESGTETDLYTTNWVHLNKDFDWHTDPVEIGDEWVFPYWIDAHEKAEIGELERIFVRVEFEAASTNDYLDCDSSCATYFRVYHDNDSEWESFKIILPFMGI